MKVRRRWTAALVALSLLAAAMPASAAPATRWEPCPVAGSAERQECATLRVPLDHRDPHGRKIDLRISRIQALGTSRGALVLIPGGPGNSGLNRPSTVNFPAEVRESFDIIGFDPRGVGQSSPVSCGMPADDARRLTPWPGPDGDISANIVAAKRVGEACARNGGDLLRHISTRNEARDVDEIRKALGRSKISYWGVSYGTYVGATYATLFPHRTDRVVLDSNDDPDPRRVARAWLANYAVGVEDRFPDFARWAADPANPLRLADSPDAVRPLFLELAAKLDREPQDWPGAVPPKLDGNALRETLLRNLYTDAGFPVLARTMAAARDGSPAPVPVLPPEAVLQNIGAVAAATICQDVTWPHDIDRIARDVRRDRVRYPLTAGMPVNAGMCAFWPHQPAERPVEVTSHGPANVLLVQNRRDVATPLSGAWKLREAFGRRAVMVTVDAGGHGSYLSTGNACGNEVVTRYLLGGARPAHDLRC